jgi:hypothetical protein
VFNLQAWIRLDESKGRIFAAVGVQQKFKGAKTIISDMLGHAQRRHDELVTHR